MYAAEFAYHRPKSLAEAQSLLQSDKDAKLLAGGHSLLPAMKLRVASPKMLVDLSGVAELSGIKAEGNALRIGATTTHENAVGRIEILDKQVSSASRDASVVARDAVAL